MTQVPKRKKIIQFIDPDGKYLFSETFEDHENTHSQLPDWFGESFKTYHDYLEDEEKKKNENRDRDIT